MRSGSAVARRGLADDRGPPARRRVALARHADDSHCDQARANAGKPVGEVCQLTRGRAVQNGRRPSQLTGPQLFEHCLPKDTSQRLDRDHDIPHLVHAHDDRQPPSRSRRPSTARRAGADEAVELQVRREGANRLRAQLGPLARESLEGHLAHAIEWTTDQQRHRPAPGQLLVTRDERVERQVGDRPRPRGDRSAGTRSCMCEYHQPREAPSVEGRRDPAYSLRSSCRGPRANDGPGSPQRSRWPP